MRETEKREREIYRNEIEGRKWRKKSLIYD